MTDDKDQDDAGEEGGHGAVPPVGAAAGPGHQGHVVAAGAGDSSEDQPVEDSQQQHGQQSHHYSKHHTLCTKVIMRKLTQGIGNDISQIPRVVS